MSKKALLNKEAIQELWQTWDIEIEIEINWQMKMFKLIDSELLEQNQGWWWQQQSQQPTPMNNNWQPLKARPPINYPWQAKWNFLNQLLKQIWPSQELLDMLEELQKINWWPQKNHWNSNAPDDDWNMKYEWVKWKRQSTDMTDEEAIQEIRKILRDNLYERRILDKRGRIETSRLAHYRTSKKLFTRKLWEKWKKYHFEILLDVSWSMFHDKRMRPSFRATHSIVKVLSKLWDVRIKLFWEISIVFTPEEFQDIADELTKNWDIDDIWKKVEKRYVEIINEKDKKYMLIRQSEYMNIYKQWQWYEKLKSKDIDDWTFEAWPVLSSLDYLRKQDWEKCLIIIHDWDVGDIWDTLVDYIDKWYNVTISWDDASIYNQEWYKWKITQAVNEWIHIQSIAIWTDTPQQFYWENSTEISNGNEVHHLLVSSLQKMVWKK